MFTMKKILFIIITTFSLFTADAQAKKSKKSGKRPGKEAIANSDFKKKEAIKKTDREKQLTAMRSEDSLRLQMDSIADLTTENERTVYKTEGLRIIDSTNKAGYGTLSRERADWEKTERDNALIMKAAKLSEYESKQVKYINQTYNEKAKQIIGSGTADQKKQELFTLNEERKAKIKTVAGKAGEKKLEKERRDYIKKNGIHTDTQWIEVAESFSKK